MLTCVEICAGAGGQALGLHMAGFHHVALVEYEQEYCDVLKQNMPEWNVICGDVHTFDGKPYAGVDLFAGGVPCPPFSVASKQLGQDDERDLFPEAIRLIMDAEMVQASLFQDFLEFFPDSWLNVMVPVRMSENQSGEISFMNTSLIAIRTLDKPVIVKSKPGEGVLGDTTEYQYERIQMDGFTLEECLTFFQHE